jgi:hypothetical protein
MAGRPEPFSSGIVFLNQKTPFLRVAAPGSENPVLARFPGIVFLTLKTPFWRVSRRSEEADQPVKVNRRILSP